MRLSAATLRLIALAATLAGMGVYSYANPGSAITFYARCSEAHAQGVYSIPRDGPGYRQELDADDDGLACEPYR